jgi:hypothetical protein
VTGLLDVASNPGLTQYFINQHLEAAYNNPPVDTFDKDDKPCVDISFVDWCKEVRQLAGEHSKEARDKGSDIHHALDLYYGDSTEDVPQPFMKYVNAVSTALEGVYGVSMGDVDSEETFATDQWGGAVDLSNPNLIVDYKFKSSGWELKKDGTPKKIWYDSHIAQLAAYRYGLGYFKATCANVFISPDAEVYIKEYTEEELKNGLYYFKACLQLWRLKNKI